MHKKFYASGFIYHPPSQKILLQQPHPAVSEPFLWSFFSTIGEGNNTPEKAFDQFISHLIPIKPTGVEAVYFYPHTEAGINHHILYATTTHLVDFPPKKGMAFGWLALRQLNKLPISPQTKHDITISIRVIDAKERTTHGEKTLQEDTVV